MPLNEDIVKIFVAEALREDAAAADITTLSFIPKDARIEARIIAKEDGIACGLQFVRKTFELFDKDLKINEIKKDGASFKKNETVLRAKGRARSILSCERVALNFLSYLSGISTATQQAVRKVKSSGIQILDTRKTTPLYRMLEKYAVVCGGGRNHRYDLSRQYLVKDNHIFILKKIRAMDVLVARDAKVPFEIEVDDLHELKKAFSYAPDIVLLDNFSPRDVKRAVQWIASVFAKKERRPLIELSGGITPENISGFAIKGVDFISLGALTHSARALDMSLEITKVLR